MKRRIIIGIHGLDNKPPEALEHSWWKQALAEGLSNIGRPRAHLNFQLVYWADILHPQPLNPKLTDPAHPLFLSEPYFPSSEPAPPAAEPEAKSKIKLLSHLEKALDKLMLKKDQSSNFSTLTDWLIEHYFEDLNTYYHGTLKGEAAEGHSSREAIRGRLEKNLRRYARRRILLIAHSMGSIIAYDVLTLTVPDVAIDTFVTCGSPLGAPFIMARNIEERRARSNPETPASTPLNVHRAWFNLSDLDDRVAMNYNLADDYSPNLHQIQAVDLVVKNNYQWQDQPNPHKSYGYLRTSEMARIIDEFLTVGKPKSWIWLESNWHKLLLWFMTKTQKQVKTAVEPLNTA